MRLRSVCKHVWPVLALLNSAPFLVKGQNQAALSEFFEGKTVVVKMDMPGSRREAPISIPIELLRSIPRAIAAGFGSMERRCAAETRW
jgi:hypothetical protein